MASAQQLSFLIALVRQGRLALRDGDEAAYDAAELILDLIDLVEPDGLGDELEDGSGGTDDHVPPLTAGAAESDELVDVPIRRDRAQATQLEAGVRAERGPAEGNGAGGAPARPLGVKRAATIEVPLAVANARASVPRGTPRMPRGKTRSKKGVKRATPR